MSCDIKKLLLPEPMSRETKKNALCPRQIRIDCSSVWVWDFSPFVSPSPAQVGCILRAHSSDKAPNLIKDFVKGLCFRGPAPAELHPSISVHRHLPGRWLLAALLLLTSLPPSQAKPELLLPFGC